MQEGKALKIRRTLDFHAFEQRWRTDDDMPLRHQDAGIQHRPLAVAEADHARTFAAHRAHPAVVAIQHLHRVRTEDARLLGRSLHLLAHALDHGLGLRARRGHRVGEIAASLRHPAMGRRAVQGAGAQQLFHIAHIVAVAGTFVGVL